MAFYYRCTACGHEYPHVRETEDGFEWTPSHACERCGGTVETFEIAPADQRTIHIRGGRFAGFISAMFVKSAKVDVEGAKLQGLGSGDGIRAEDADIEIRDSEIEGGTSATEQ